MDRFAYKTVTGSVSLSQSVVKSAPRTGTGGSEMGSPRESQYVTGEYASGASKESTIAGTRSASI